MSSPTHEAARIALHEATGFLAFNLILALIPLVLAVGLFVRDSRWTNTVPFAMFAVLVAGLVQLPHRRSLLLMLVALSAFVLGRSRPRGALAPIWWVGLILFLLFLPNAAYVLADGLHYTRNVGDAHGALGATAIYTVLYACYTAVGVASYLACIHLVHSAIKRHWNATRARVAVIAMTGAVAIGLYIGRIEQLHSWQPFTQSRDTIAIFREQLARVEVWAFIIGAVVAIGALTYASAVWRRWLVASGVSPARSVVATVCVGAAAYPLAALLVVSDVATGFGTVMAGLFVLVSMACGLAGAVVLARRSAVVPVLATTLFLGAYIGLTFIAVDHAERAIVPGKVRIRG